MQAPPAVSGEGVDAEDQKLATALVTEAAAPQAGQMWQVQLWLLPSPMAGRGMFQPGSKDDAALGRLVARGSNALPLLMAMATDETLCPMLRSAIAGRSANYVARNITQIAEYRGPNHEVRHFRWYSRLRTFAFHEGLRDSAVRNSSICGSTGQFNRFCGRGICPEELVCKGQGLSRGR